MPMPTPSLWRRTSAFWISKTGIDWPTYKSIFKDTVAPTIGLAANQATPWSNVFGMLGFLVPIVSIISRPSPPRAEFLWVWVTNILGSCISAAVTALAYFCVIKAREQSGPPVADPSDAPYNAVASTVAALWLIVQTYIISAVRYNYPRLTWMTSACLVFSNYGMVYVVQFPDMTAALSFLKQLFFAHLVGFGISAGIALFVFPTNSREPFFRTVLACTEEMQLSLRTNIQLMECAVDENLSSASKELNDARKQHKVKLDSLQAKLVLQVRGAQNEIAWGILPPADLRTLTDLIEEVIIPLIGLCRVPDVMEQTLQDGNVEAKDRKQLLDQYRVLLASVMESFSRATAAAGDGLKRTATIIGLDAPTAAVRDAGSDKETHVQRLQREMDLLVESKADLLNAWHARHESPDSHSSTDSQLQGEFGLEKVDQSRSNLHIVLYTELLLWSICHRVQELLVWTEELRSSEVLKKKRLIMPEWTNPGALASMIRHWMGTLDNVQSSQNSAHQLPNKRHHKSPRNLWALILHLLSKCTRFFASPASGFALRVTCATMSIAIVAYLPSTQKFYIKQHLVWAQYAVSYAMQGSAGQGVRALVFRMCGTIVAVCLAWVSWYIVVGIPAGVLVFYWLSIHFPMYILALKPRYSTVGTVSAFALTTVLGNALQPNGSGQPTILLGAVRLAALGGGCLLATIWTLFPFPASDHDGARKSLGACLACLAEYHTGFHTIIRIRLKQSLKQDNLKPHDRELEDMHARLFAKCNSHLQALRSRLKLAKWNILTDGQLYSRSQYQHACEKIDSLMRNMQLLTFATGIFIDFVSGQPPTLSNCSLNWLDDFQNLFNAAQHDGIGVAALLGLLSHSVRNEAALPPHLVPPSPLKLWQYFDEPERIAQQVRQVDDPGAAMFALMRLGTKGLYKDLSELFELVKEMVGEFDFVCGFAIDEEE